jgi:hypothetical protein
LSLDNKQANLWNKGNNTGAKLTKSTSLFTDMVGYANDNNNMSMQQQQQLQQQTNINQQQAPFCYSNCFVVNIDGPINFNATHSLQDDGSDLPLNDINTIRFFYNLGIEYYRLNLATPYNAQIPPSYSTCYAPTTNTSTNPISNSILTSGNVGGSTNNNNNSTANNSLPNMSLNNTLVSQITANAAVCNTNTVQTTAPTTNSVTNNANNNPSISNQENKIPVVVLSGKGISNANNKNQPGTASAAARRAIH